MPNGIETTIATSSAQLQSVAPIEKMAASFGYQSIMFLALVGGITLTFFLIVGFIWFIGKLRTKK